MEIVEAAGISLAVVAGACVGADFERALEVDLRIAGDGARFSTAGVADPVVCGVRLARLLGEARAKELGAREHDLQLLPDRHGTDGFYLAGFRREGA